MKQKKNSPFLEVGGGGLSKMPEETRLKKFTKNKKTKRILIGSVVGILILIGGLFLYKTYAYYEEEKEYNILKGTIPYFETCSVEPNTSNEYGYTEKEETFVAPCSGIYKLEVWGAEGGSYNTTCQGGLGAYAKGYVQLKQGETLYINVGGKGLGDGTHQYRKGGYNGGGEAFSNEDGNTRQSSGGGATHIAKKSGLLKTLENEKESILIVASGGGGGGGNSAIMCVFGGNAGGIVGNNGGTYTEGTTYKMYSTGGSQTTGGKYIANANSCKVGCSTGSFGQGGNGVAAGGGGGFYGGASSEYSGGGGSSYIANPLLINYKEEKKEIVCMNCEESEEGATYTKSTTVSSSIPSENQAKQNDGYAKITYIASK